MSLCGARAGASIAGAFGLSVALVCLLSGCHGFQRKPLDIDAELAALVDRGDPRWIVDHVRVRDAAETTGQASNGDRAAEKDGEEAAKKPAVDLSDGLDEDELVAIGLSINPGIQAKRLEAGEAESLLVSAGIWPNPEVGFAWRPGLDASGYIIETDLLFELLRPWEKAARKAAAGARLDEVNAAIVAEEWRLVVAVRTQHLNVLSGEQVLALLGEEVALRSRLLDLVKAGRDAGERTALDISLAELQLAEARRDERRAATELEASRRELNRLLGLPPGYALKLTASGKPLEVTVFDDVTDDDLRFRVLRGRFELRAKEAAYRKAEEELRLAVYKQVPRFKVGPSYERELEGDDTLGIGLSLELPLFDRNQGEIAEKEKLRERAHAEYVALLHGLLADAFEARGRLERARMELETQEKEVLPQVERTQQLFESAFRARELSLVEWVAARERAMKTRTGYLETLTRYRRSLIDLEAATGIRLARAEAMGPSGP